MHIRERNRDKQNRRGRGEKHEEREGEKQKKNETPINPRSNQNTSARRMASRTKSMVGSMQGRMFHSMASCNKVRRKKTPWRGCSGQPQPQDGKEEGKKTTHLKTQKDAGRVPREENVAHHQRDG